MSRVSVALAVFGAVLAAAPAYAQSEAVQPPEANAPSQPAPAVPEKPVAPPPVQEPPSRGPAVENAPGESMPGEGLAGENSEGRYTFSRVQDGYVRLDNRTGQLLFCGKRNVGWTCQLAPEDREVLENEIARLQEENVTLKKDLLKRGLPLPSGTKPVPPVAQDSPALAPGEPRIERVKAFVEKVWRRLVDLVVSLQKDALKKS